MKITTTIVMMSMLLLCGVFTTHAEIPGDDRIRDAIFALGGTSADWEAYKEYSKDMVIPDSFMTGAAKRASIYTMVTPYVIAAVEGIVEPYVYVYDEASGYQPILCLSLNALPKWCGYFIKMKEKADIWTLPNIYLQNPATESKTLANDTYYLISPPLTTASLDIGDNFNDDFGNKWEDTCRFSKWSDGYGYIRYTAKGNTFLDLMPGRGFWAYHVQGNDVTIDIDGQYIRPRPTDDTSYPRYQAVPGHHMIGNPYPYGITALNLWFSAPGSGIHAAKQVSADVEYKPLDAWYLELQLKDSGGKLADMYNRAGVVESGMNGISDILCASDLVPPGDFVRLYLNSLNGTADEQKAYDYRAPGLDTYTWQVTATTTLTRSNARLSLNNFSSIPEGYTITLTDTRTGTVYPLTADSSFDVILSSGAPQTYLLTAARQKPAAVSETVPAALALKNIHPNPFNPSTTISFDVNKAGQVKLDVYNVGGQLVDTLVNGPMQAGSHQVVWNASKHSSGVYLVKMTCNGFTETRKVTFMK